MAADFYCIYRAIGRVGCFARFGARRNKLRAGIAVPPAVSRCDWTYGVPALRGAPRSIVSKRNAIFSS